MSLSTTRERRGDLVRAAQFAVVLYAMTWAALLYAGQEKSGPAFIVAVMSQAFPGLLAVVFCLAHARRREQFAMLALHRWGGLRWAVFALLVPMLVIALSYTVADIAGLVEFKPVAERGSMSTVLLRHTKGYVYMIVLGTFIWAFAEEIGWRGYLQSLLGKTMSPLPASLTIGFIWAVWHFPFILLSDYYSAGNPFLNCLLFTITVTAMGGVYGWTRMKSGSVWPAVLMHAGSNSAWGIWQYEYQGTSPLWVYFAGEAGLFNAILWIALAAWVWKRAGRQTQGVPVPGALDSRGAH